MNDNSYYLKKVCTFVSQKWEENKHFTLFSILREVAFWNVSSFSWEIEFLRVRFNMNEAKHIIEKVIACALQLSFLSTKQETNIGIFHWKSKIQIMNVISDELSILRTITYR